jgi:hypothetical protein
LSHDETGLAFLCGRFDTNNFRAEIGEHDRASTAWRKRCEIEHADASERFENGHV